MERRPALENTRVLLEKPPWTRLQLSRDWRSREGAWPGSCYALGCVCVECVAEFRVCMLWMCVWLLREDVSSREKLSARQTPLSMFGPCSPWQQQKHAFFTLKKPSQYVSKHMLGSWIVCLCAWERENMCKNYSGCPSCMLMCSCQLLELIYLTVLPQEWWQEWWWWRWWNDEGLTGHGQWNHFAPQLMWWAAVVNTHQPWHCPPGSVSTGCPTCTPTGLPANTRDSQ